MADRPIDPVLLRTFLTVVDSGGFSAAARRLLRGQSAVSLQIKRLEAQIGAELLERGPRRLTVTAAGEVMLDYARRILALHDELLARVGEPELHGVVRIGAPEDFATTHLPQVLATFTRSYPQVALEVTCELTLEVLDRFASGGLDLALVKREPAGEEAGRRVWLEPLVWAGSPHWTHAPEEVLPLVVSPPPCVYRLRATKSLETVGRAWRIAYTCGSLAGTHAAVHAGLGVTVLPKEMVPASLVILDNERHGLPDLRDTEIVLMEATSLSPPARRLSAYIAAALEHGPS